MSTLVVLRLIHVVVGVAWAGCILFIAFFLVPAVNKLGPRGGPVMEELMVVRKMSLYLMTGVIVTILSGLSLYWIDSAGFTSKVWLASSQARVLGIGAVLTIVTAAIGAAVNGPTARKLAVLGAQVQAAGGPPSPAQATEMGRLRGRLRGAINATAVLIVVAVACMAVARYV
jgi:uncharacterized membrane protein